MKIEKPKNIKQGLNFRIYQSPVYIWYYTRLSSIHINKIELILVHYIIHIIYIVNILPTFPFLSFIVNYYDQIMPQFHMTNHIYIHLTLIHIPIHTIHPHILYKMVFFYFSRPFFYRTLKPCKFLSNRNSNELHSL